MLRCWPPSIPRLAVTCSRSGKRIATTWNRLASAHRGEASHMDDLELVMHRKGLSRGHARGVLVHADLRRTGRRVGCEPLQQELQAHQQTPAGAERFGEAATSGGRPERPRHLHVRHDSAPGAVVAKEQSGLGSQRGAASVVVTDGAMADAECQIRMRSGVEDEPGFQQLYARGIAPGAQAGACLGADEPRRPLDLEPLSRQATPQIASSLRLPRIPSLSTSRDHRHSPTP